MGSIGGRISQDFLSRYGVELNPPQGEIRESKPGSDPAAKPKENPPDLEQLEPQLPPRAAKSELSRLMLNLARETYSTTAVDKLLDVDNGDDASKLAKADRDALRELAESAADALAKISGLTVQDILDDKGSSKIEELFETAADLQLQLGNMLRELSSSEKYEGDNFGEFREMLDDISLKCDSRGSEIMTLYCEVRDYGEKKKASQVGGSDEFQKAKVGDLVKGMAGSMHGNDKSLLFKGRVDSIEARLARFSAATAVNANDLGRLLAETEELSAELKRPDVAQTMDADIHKALTTHLDGLRAKVGDRVDRAVEEAERGLLKQCGELNRLGKDIVGFLGSRKDACPVLSRLMSALVRLEGEGLKDGDATIGEIADCLDEPLLSKLHDDLNYYRALKTPAKPPFENPNRGEPLVECLLRQIGISTKLKSVLSMAKRTIHELRERRRSWGDGAATKLAGEDVVNAFRRNDSLSMVLEARVHGCNEGDCDPQLCDRNLVNMEKLGSGAANTVYKMTYRMDDGSLKDYVFKPDLCGRCGLETLATALHSYTSVQQAVKLNLATCDLAEFLGLGRLIGRNYATVHDGQYGLLMEMAPGTTACKVSEDASPENLARFNDPSVVGRLARELNDLMWLDIATGQCDRHHENYMVDFGKDGKTPKVTAIDNDVSFAPYLVGVGKYKIDRGYRLDVFLGELKRTCGGSDKPLTGNRPGRSRRGKSKTGKASDESEKAQRYQGIVEGIQANGNVIDVRTAGKEVICALRKTFYAQSFALPRQMSRSLCTKLKSLTDEQIDGFAKTLAKNVDRADSVAATVQRLKDLRQIACDYDRDGRIVEDDQWGSKDVVLKELECPDLLKDANDDSDPYDMNKTVARQMSSILRRNFGQIVPLGENLV